MRILRHFSILFLALIIGGISCAQSLKPVFKLDDLQKLVRFSDPRISPDGKEIAIIVSRPDWKTDKNKQKLELIKVSDASMRKLTFNREGLSNIRWSPDGLHLAFIAKESKTKKSQIFVMPMNGGDAQRITQSKTGIEEYTWSPDGQQITFVAQDSIPNPKAIKHHEDAFRVTDNHYRVKRIPQPWHLWMIPSKGGKAKRLTKGSWSFKTDQGSMSQVVWTKDVKAIVFQQFPDVWQGNINKSILSIVDTSGNQVQSLVTDTGSRRPTYAPNDNKLAFMRARKGDLNNGKAIYVSTNGKNRDVTATLARNINSYKWFPDGKSLLLSGGKGTQSVFWDQPLNGEASLLNLGDINPSGRFTISKNGMIAFTASTPSHPTEVYIYRLGMEKPQRLTNLNAFVDQISLGKTEGIQWKGPENFKEDGVLTYPPTYKSGSKYPLVLLIHGGPESASTVKFSPLAQLIAARGFLVFQPNYRGSNNLGDAYQHAIYRNTGKGPGQDVMAGLKKLTQMGIVDVDRIGVTGWSYGGYMTSWLIGNYPTVWKAAVSGAALNDWVMDYTISFYQKGDLYFFGGSPWVKDYWKIWREQSPIAYALRIKTPTLIMGDVGDPNVPIINSYQLFHALRDNGVNVEFYAYPVDTHFPHDIVRTTDVYRRWVDWMVKYLK